MLDIAATCLVITALLAYLNHRFVGLPTSIGVMAAALLLSLALVGLDAAGRGARPAAVRRVAAALDRFLGRADAGHAVAAAVCRRAACRPAASSRPTAGRSARWPCWARCCRPLVVGFAMWLVLPLAGLHLPLIYCLLFGALISPTDPIAVMGILKIRRRAEGTGTGDRRRVAVQRWRGRRDLLAAAGRAGQRRHAARRARACSCCCAKRAAACCSAWRSAT